MSEWGRKLQGQSSKFKTEGEVKRIDYRKLYLDNGFFWNDDLAAFVKEYAGQEIKYPNDSFRNTRFCDPAFITSLKGYGAVERMADYLGEAVAPVPRLKGATRWSL